MMSMNLLDRFSDLEFTIDFRCEGEWMLALVNVSPEGVKIIDAMNAEGDTPANLTSDILQEVELLAQCVWMDEVADVPAPEIDH